MAISSEKIEYFKGKLLEEKAALEKELGKIGRINPENPKDWEALPEKEEHVKSDRNEAADSIEGYEENTAILKQLEIRFNEVIEALNRIEKGVYGVCEVSGEDIEEDRLEANPAARTCKAHIESK